MSAEIKTITNEEISLIAGDGGVFEIRQNGQIIFKKERHGNFPTANEVKALFVTS